MRSLTSFPVIRRRGSFVLRLVAATALAGAVTACSTGTPTETGAPAATAAAYGGIVISAASLTPGQPVPKPAGKAVLTLTGKITATNRDGALALDQSTIEKMGVEQVQLYEPWTKETLDFRGVWLQHLLAVAGAAPDATKVHIVALDDYAVDLSLADVRAGGIMLATRDGAGGQIPVDKGGPTRIVFMDGVKAGDNPDQWVWSLKSIDVQ